MVGHRTHPLAPLIAVVVLGVLGGALGPPALAEALDPTPQLTLVRQPVSHETGDPLGLILRVSNPTPIELEGFKISVTAHDKLVTRSGLHEAFLGQAGFEASSFPKEFLGEEVSPGGEDLVRLNDPIGTSLVSIGSSDEAGVYPLTLSLYDATGVTLLDSLTTTMLYQPLTPEVPLVLALVVPLNHLPSRGPDGVFHEVDGTFPLEAAIAPGGWLRALVETLDELTTAPEPPEPRRRRGRRRPPQPPPEAPLRLGLAPVPRLLDELADMANGYRKDDGAEVLEVPQSADEAEAAASLIQTIGGLLSKDEIQPILVPYGFADLPALDLEGTVAQLAQGEQVIADVTEVDIDRSWLFPPAGRLDRTTLEGLSGAQAADSVFLSESSLLPTAEPGASGCPQTFASFTCPVTVDTVGTTTGLVFDDGIQQRFDALRRADVEAPLALQNLFAEIAMIHSELPGTDGRVLTLSVPALWTPDAATVERFLRGLARAPWLEPMTPREASLGAPEIRERRVVEVAGDVGAQPDETFYSTVAEAQRTLDSFRAAVGSSPSGRVDRLAKNLLVAVSRLWWGDEALQAQGLAYAQATQREVEEQLGNISVGGVDAITMTSRRGDVQLQISNENAYAVTVELALTSEKLTFDETLSELRVPADGTLTVEVEATAEASGTFPLQVSLETPDGYPIAEKTVTIRSTEFNRVGVVVTLGALGFLILFYVFRGVRGRGASTESAGAKRA